MVSANEISRTAFKRVGHDFSSPYGYLKPGLDRNKICPYCKSEDTDTITDDASLSPYRDWYGAVRFTLMGCPRCNARWTYALDVYYPNP